ncbi:MAG: PilZ domain-containing protein [Acidobacteriota bacterium]
MSEIRRDSADSYPEVGGRVSLALMSSVVERVATVKAISTEETSLELTRPDLPVPFSPGEPIWMKHCDAEDILYWGGIVNHLSGPQKQTVSIADSGDWIRLERRKYSRLAVDVPISFRVQHAFSTQVSTELVYSNQIHDLSVGGLAFKTQVSLETGDELQINFDVAWPQELVASGWIVRSEPIHQDGEELNLVALEFLGLETREHDLIQEFLDHAQVKPS